MYLRLWGAFISSNALAILTPHSWGSGKMRPTIAKATQLPAWIATFSRNTTCHGTHVHEGDFYDDSCKVPPIELRQESGADGFTRTGLVYFCAVCSTQCCPTCGADSQCQHIWSQLGASKHLSNAWQLTSSCLNGAAWHIVAWVVDGGSFHPLKWDLRLCLRDLIPWQERLENVSSALTQRKYFMQTLQGQ